MISKRLVFSALTAMMLLSGCNNEAEDRMATQQMLDSGNFDGVITALEEKEVKTDEDNLKLASAYMDKAGFSTTDLVSIISSTEDQNNEVTFASFVTSIDENKDEDTLNNLQKAIEYYSALVDVTKLSPSLTSNYNQDIEDLNLDTNELFLGLAYITKTASVLSYMGDVSKLEEFGDDENLLAAGCALSKVYASNEIPEECASVNYAGATVIDGTTYTPIEVVLSNGLGSYNLLATQDRTQLVLTDYTTVCNDNFPCPVKDDKLTVLESLLDTLNSSFDLIESAAPDDVKQDVESYKNEINTDYNSDISVSELVHYLNAEMAKN